MKPSDRSRLTSALRDQVAKIAADLRTKMRAPGANRDRAKQLHADEQVAEDLDVWTDLLSRRAAVLWVLKSVYVRVLEDRGLLAPGRLLDPEAQQLFERLAPTTSSRKAFTCPTQAWNCSEPKTDAGIPWHSACSSAAANVYSLSTMGARKLTNFRIANRSTCSVSGCVMSWSNIHTDGKLLLVGIDDCAYTRLDETQS